MDDMTAYGWSPYWDALFDEHRREGLAPARVAADHGAAYEAWTEYGALSAQASGKLRHAAQSRADLPAVGDWVAVAPRVEEGAATIHAVLPRRGKLARNAAGDRTEEQVLAANIDTVFLVSGLDHDFNVRRIERYITLAWDSGAKPVIVLNKADLCDDAPGRMAEAEAVAMGAPVLVVSAMEDRGVDALRRHLGASETGALLGSSGVGKSSLINALAGTRLAVNAVRDDDSRGRHTTTHREMIPLPGGGVLIDTPGLREIQLWAESGSLAGAFGDIANLAGRCRFRDCTHTGEPGCAVRAAVEEGELDEERHASYEKLQRELRYAATKQDQRARAEQKARHKALCKEVKRFTQWREGRR